MEPEKDGSGRKMMELGLSDLAGWRNRVVEAHKAKDNIKMDLLIWEASRPRPEENDYAVDPILDRLERIELLIENLGEHKNMSDSGPFYRQPGYRGGSERLEMCGACGRVSEGSKNGP
jgi:hypothetical protein